jgi:hypothetical protein
MAAMMGAQTAAGSRDSRARPHRVRAPDQHVQPCAPRVPISHAGAHFTQRESILEPIPGS